MAKNTFLIRSSVDVGHAGTYAETEIDLGSYTNLGSSKPEVLRIHRAIIQMYDSNGEVPSMSSNTAGSGAWQLLTKSASGIRAATDDGWVCGGISAFRNPDGSTNPPTQTFAQQHLPQDYENGYVVAVPSLYLGGLADSDFTEAVNYAVVLECTTEAMTKANAVAQAISQQ